MSICSSATARMTLIYVTYIAHIRHKTVVHKSNTVSYSRNTTKIIFLYKLSRIIHHDTVLKMYVSSIYAFSFNVH